MRDDVVADRADRRRVWLLTLSFVIVAGGVTAIGVPWELPRHELGIALGIALLFGATEHWVLGIRLTHRTHSLTLSEFPLMLGLYVLSPMTLLIARLIGVLPVLVLGRHQAPRKFCFNLAAQWLETLVAIAIIVALDPQRALVGPAGFVAVLLMAFGVTVTVAMQLTAVISANAGTFRPRLATSIFSELIGPNLATTAFAVSTLVLILVSPWLLWAPVAIVAVLFVAYRSHLTLVHLNDRQSQLLSFTRTTTGREGVTAAAEQVVQATVELAGVTAVGIAAPAADGSLSWLAGHVDLGLTPRLAVPSGIDGGHAEFGVDDRRILSWTLEEGGTTLIAEVDWTATTTKDLRRTIDQIANHARVAIANASHAQALRAQAATAEMQARTDPLTGLPNRTALRAELARALDGGGPFATLLLDLDHFKEINDALGHAAGDEVLREVGRRLSTMQHDARMIARLGGDEFAVLIDGGQAGGVEWANRLLAVIRAPVQVEPYALEIDGSVGIAVHPDHSTSADELLSYADLAMYEAKAERLGVSIFGTAAAGQAVRHLAISTSMRTALGDGQITAVYQPQIDLRTEQIVGVEALARWTHPELGPIRPEEFVRVAEQAGLLHELTDAMVDDALQWQRRWAADGFDLQVAVNINPRTLLDAELPRRLARAVDKHSVAADRLTVEITEGSVMTDPPRTRAVLARIHDLGVKVSIDDFGTGYSSLAYLQDLPADEVKIDKSFVLPMAGRRTALPLVSGIIRLCHELGFTVVAEGIERSEVQATLRGLGCDRGQGFVIARPMAAEDITTWALAHRDRWTIPKERRLN